MKTIKFYFASLTMFVVISCNAPGEPTGGDEDAVRALITDWVKARNVGDTETMKGMYLEDAVLKLPWSTWIHGRDTIFEEFNFILAEGRTMSIDIVDVRFLSPTIAVVYANALFTGGMINNEESVFHERPFLEWQDSATWFLKKENGEWKLAEMVVTPLAMNYEEAEAGIEKSWDGFMEQYIKGDAAGTANFFTANYIQSNPGNKDLLIGREGWLTAAESFFSNTTVVDFKRNSLSLQVHGQFAYERGEWADETIENDEESTSDQGRYSAVWRLGSDGVWRFHRFIWNRMPAD